MGCTSSKAAGKAGNLNDTGTSAAAPNTAAETNVAKASEAVADASPAPQQAPGLQPKQSDMSTKLAEVELVLEEEGLAAASEPSKGTVEPDFTGQASSTIVAPVEGSTTAAAVATEATALGSGEAEPAKISTDDAKDGDQQMDQVPDAIASKTTAAPLPESEEKNGVVGATSGSEPDTKASNDESFSADSQTPRVQEDVKVETEDLASSDENKATLPPTNGEIKQVELTEGAPSQNEEKESSTSNAASSDQPTEGSPGHNEEKKGTTPDIISSDLDTEIATPEPVVDANTEPEKKAELVITSDTLAQDDTSEPASDEKKAELVITSDTLAQDDTSEPASDEKKAELVITSDTLAQDDTCEPASDEKKAELVIASDTLAQDDTSEPASDEKKAELVESSNTSAQHDACEPALDEKKTELVTTSDTLTQHDASKPAAIENDAMENENVIVNPSSVDSIPQGNDATVSTEKKLAIGEESSNTGANGLETEKEEPETQVGGTDVQEQQEALVATADGEVAGESDQSGGATVQTTSETENVTSVDKAEADTNEGVQEAEVSSAGAPKQDETDANTDDEAHPSTQEGESPAKLPIQLKTELSVKDKAKLFASGELYKQNSSGSASPGVKSLESAGGYVRSTANKYVAGELYGQNITTDFASVKVSADTKRDDFASKMEGSSVRDIASKFQGKQTSPEPSSEDLGSRRQSRLDEVSEVTRERHSSTTMAQYWKAKEDVETMVATKRDF